MSISALETILARAHALRDKNYSGTKVIVSCSHASDPNQCGQPCKVVALETPAVLVMLPVHGGVAVQCFAFLFHECQICEAEVRL